MRASEVERDAPAPEELFESKLHPPSLRSASVARTALVDRLAKADDIPIASVVAPAGYGKTTLLAEWAQREPARVAWLSLDALDNDLGVLFPYTAAALDRVEAVDPELLQFSPRRRSVATAAAGIARALASMSRPVVLVLDHVESLNNHECLDTIAELALHLPQGARLALASRGELPLPMPLLRARGEVVDVGVDDLAMTTAEARALLEAAGAHLSDDDVTRLIERTEGWPVGLYFAALALNAGGTFSDAGHSFSGDDSLVADFLRAEVLAQLSTDEVEFLTKTSVLDRMSAGLCDAVLDSSGSHEVLAGLARSNRLLVALDHQGEWYRYHHLFRDLLRAELERREPDATRMLNLRAAQWCARQGLPDLAIEHAISAGEADLVNELLLVHAASMHATGRGASLRRWLQWVDDQGFLPRYPAMSVIGALHFNSAGMAPEAEYWADAAQHPAVDLRLEDGTTVAERAAPTRVLPDGSMLEGLHAVLRMLMARQGLAAIRRDGEIALEDLGPSNGYRGIAYACIAMCDMLEADFDAADRRFMQSADLAVAARRIPTIIVALSERGLIACARDAWDDAADLAQEALNLVETWSMEDYSECALADALAARVAVHRRDVDRARDHLARAARLRPHLSYARPITSVQTLLEMARVYTALEDVAGARAVLHQAREVLRHRPDLGPLPDQVDELLARLDTMTTGTVGATSLTAAELRLVPFLPTHLTFPQIAERLYVSRNTVKSQAISVYQKVGVSSRGAAVQRLVELGLLDA